MSLRAFCTEQFPALDLQPRSAFTNELLPLLRSGVLDAALVILPLDGSDVRHEVVLEESLIVALPERHSLARRRSIALAELSDTPAISIPRHINPSFYVSLMACCEREGLRPKVFQEVTTFAEAQYLVAKGLGFTLARDSFRPVKHPGIVFRPLKGNPLTVETGIAYSTKRQSVFLQEYLATIKGRKRPQSAKSNPMNWRTVSATSGGR